MRRRAMERVRTRPAIAASVAPKVSASNAGEYCMKHIVIVALAGLGALLAGCGTEGQIQSENARANSECRSAGLHPGKIIQGTFSFDDDEKKWAACVREHRQAVRVAADIETCKAQGMAPGTPAMNQCVAGLQRKRSDQLKSDYAGALAQMRH